MAQSTLAGPFYTPCIYILAKGKSKALYKRILWIVKEAVLKTTGKPFALTTGKTAALYNALLKRCKVYSPFIYSFFVREACARPTLRTTTRRDRDWKIKHSCSTKYTYARIQFKVGDN